MHFVIYTINHDDDDDYYYCYWHFSIFVVYCTYYWADALEHIYSDD